MYTVTSNIVQEIFLTWYLLHVFAVGSYELHIEISVHVYLVLNNICLELIFDQMLGMQRMASFFSCTVLGLGI